MAFNGRLLQGDGFENVSDNAHLMATLFVSGVATGTPSATNTTATFVNKQASPGFVTCSFNPSTNLFRLSLNGTFACQFPSACHVDTLYATASSVGPSSFKVAAYNLTGNLATSGGSQAWIDFGLFSGSAGSGGTIAGSGSFIAPALGNLAWATVVLDAKVRNS